MDPKTNGQRHADRADEDDGPTGWRWRLPRALGILAFLVIATFWIYVFANGSSVPHPDEFDDPTFIEAAESLCAERQQAIADLGTPAAVENPQERAVLLRAATVELRQMVAELADLPDPIDPKGASGVPMWLADYEIYLQDRDNYAELLEAGEDPAFVISGNAQGVRVTDLLTTFAEVNDMRSCGPSGDV